MTDHNDSNFKLQENKNRNVRNISLGMLLIQSVSVLYILVISGFSASLFVPVVLIGINIFSALASYVLYRKNRPILGIQIILGFQTLTIFSMSFILEDVAFPSGLFLMVVVFAIANATLSPRLIGKTIKWVAIIAILGILQDSFNPFGITRITNNTNTSWILTVFFTFIFLILILRQFHRYTLRIKLILGFVISSTLIISIAFTLVTVNMRGLLTSSAQEQLFANASVSAKSIDNFLTYSLDSVNTASASLTLRSYLLLSPKIRTDSLKEQQVQNLLFTLANSNADILSYGILDLDGINILDSDSRNIGKSEEKYDYFQRPLNANNKYISPVVYNDPNVVIGILRVKYRASVLQKLFSSEKSIAGEEAFSVLFDSNHIILAHSSNPSLIGKITYEPDATDIKNLRDHHLLSLLTPDDQLFHNFATIDEGLRNFVTTPYFSSEETELDEAVSGAIIQLETLPWLVISAQPNDMFLMPIEKQIRRIIITSLVLITLAVFAGVGLANILVAPIIRLENTAQEFVKGNLNVKASIDANDEIGSLATTFNNLSSQLGNTIETLETRVTERTKALESRTNYLEGAAEISRVLSSITESDTLIIKIANLIKQRFNLYYVGLFLVDDENKYAILKAGTGKAGRKMLKRQHKIKIGTGMIGWSIENEKYRIALDVGEDAVQFENPDLPETRSEGALPLRSRGRVLGALTIQSTEESAFDEFSITALQTMVDQIAIALDNAELFVQSEAALLAERKAYGQLSQKSWKEITQNQAISRFIVNENGKVKAVKTVDPSVNLTRATEKSKFLENDNLTAIIPIKNRDYILGGIKIRKNKDAKPWTKEELGIIEAISEQLSVALESARLLDETQRKAQREAVISEISSKIGSSMLLDNILKTTARELGKALESPEVIFEIVDPSKEAQTE